MSTENTLDTKVTSTVHAVDSTMTKLHDARSQNPNVETPINVDPFTELRRAEFDENDGSWWNPDQVAVGIQCERDRMKQLDLAAEGSSAETFGGS